MHCVEAFLLGHNFLFIYLSYIIVLAISDQGSGFKIAAKGKHET